MLTRRIVLSFATAFALALPAAAQDRLSIVATTGMIADAARQVGGDLVDVTALMGPGVDPHAYRQTRSDIVATAQADLVLWNGLYLEAQLEEFLLELAETRPVVAVAEAIPETQLIGSEDYEDRFDPHVWMNPNLWSRVVLATPRCDDRGGPLIMPTLSPPMRAAIWKTWPHLPFMRKAFWPPSQPRRGCF